MRTKKVNNSKVLKAHQAKREQTWLICLRKLDRTAKNLQIVIKNMHWRKQSQTWSSLSFEAHVFHIEQEGEIHRDQT